MDALTNPLINHRGPEFKDLLYSTTDRLKKVFMTDNDLYILTASGTGALEAALVNTLSPGDKVLAAVAGIFGQRFADMAETHGARVTRVEFEWGQAIDSQALRDALKSDPEIKAVLLTHNETSTGVTNDLETLAAIVKEEFDKLLLVDAISSLGCIPLPVDRWNCDVVATASQKGFLVPPGLSFISFSPRAWEAHKTATMTRFYFDMTVTQCYLERGQTPFTPGLPLFYALDLALDMLLAKGMEETFAHHAYFGRMTREGVRSMGLSLFPEESCASNTVSAIRVPQGVDGKALADALRTEHGVVVAGGLGHLEGKIFRVGHMGAVEEAEIQGFLSALRAALAKMGFHPRE
jgi:aspartate aminotransferase-like enzyme